LPQKIQAPQVKVIEETKPELKPVPAPLKVPEKVEEKKEEAVVKQDAPKPLP